MNSKISKTYFSVNQWQNHISRHKEILSPIIIPHIERANTQIKHPILDFLFNYYHFKASKLMQWSPGLNCTLENISDTYESKFSLEHLSAHASTNQNQLTLHTKEFPKNRELGLGITINLLKKTLINPAHFGCFGMHEWAMVYDISDIRHQQLPLRLPHSEIKNIVESNTITCTHYDAFRFFSKQSKPFNVNILNKDNRDQFEQAGCLHANMDLYRWSSKYYPWVSSDLIRDTFLLAKDIREVDMRASPYDVSEFNLPAIKIETQEGKLSYIDYQKEFSKRAKPLRSALIEQLETLKQHIESS